MHTESSIKEVHVNVESSAFILYYIHSKEGSIRHTHSVLHPFHPRHTHTRTHTALKSVGDKEHIIKVVIFKPLSFLWLGEKAMNKSLLAL